MKIVNNLIGAVLLIYAAACVPEIEEIKYPEITSLDDTEWLGYDQRNNIYYDATFTAESNGTLLGYDSAERVNEVSNNSFTYSFALEPDGVVRMNLDNCKYYGGFLVQKGNFQISNKDVYIIQLYGVDESGEVIYNSDGTIHETLMLWRE